MPARRADRRRRASTPSLGASPTWRPASVPMRPRPGCRPDRRLDLVSRPARPVARRGGPRPESRRAGATSLSRRASPEALGLPAFLERDTNVAIMGEWRYGAARGASDAIYITVSTGIGGGTISDGRPIVGRDGTAGEFGHVTVELDGPLCGCGGVGHVEAIASGTALARGARALVERRARLAARAACGRRRGGRRHARRPRRAAGDEACAPSSSAHGSRSAPCAPRSRISSIPR